MTNFPDRGTRTTVSGLLSEISDVGRDRARGGYSRPVYSDPELDLRMWFTEQAQRRDLDVNVDRNGLIWAWLDVPGGDRSNAVVTGSHLDSVPGGGAFDGPLGVATALVAIDNLKAVGDRSRPVAIAVFPEEEGSRFGVACLGSGLLTGTLDANRVRNLTDDDGTTFAEVSAAHGIDPAGMGRDPEAVARIGAFVELHVEQGRALIDQPDTAIGVGTSILGHGRWKLSVTGQGNHAGTTLMSDRRDPMLVAARIISDVRRCTRAVPDARATVGRIVPTPGGTNVIASRVDLWLDVRHPDDTVASALVTNILGKARAVALDEGCSVELVEESFSPTVRFDSRLRQRISSVLPSAPLLATGAGHDAGVLARFVPTGMLFVRNPTGISHSPEEHVEDADADAGADALAAVLAGLAR